MKWKADQMIEQTGKVAVVTGSNTGTGYHIAHGLASKGAKVIMACRNLEKAEAARNNTEIQTGVSVAWCGVCGCKKAK